MTTYGAQMDQKWTGSGSEVGRKWPEVAGSGPEVGRKWVGSGPEVGRKWAGSATYKF